MSTFTKFASVVMFAMSMSNHAYSQDNYDSNQTFTEITISVPTIKCGTCVKTVTNALKELEGVKEVNVDKKTKLAVITYYASKLKVADIEIAIAKSGYDANEVKRDKKAYNELDSCCR